ncbi:MAG: NAD(P)(+) transhydrogenase (Re/Si-specific) subunit beta [Candidatus Izemoplasmatales bacterium]
MNNFLILSIINETAYYIISGILTLCVMFGIFLMSKVEKAKIGNAISAFAVLIAVIVSLVMYDILPIWVIYVCLAIGGAIGLFLAYKVKMIEMPQLIALLNGFGGLASLIVGGYAYFGVGVVESYFSDITALIAVIIGSVTFIGSLVAAGKLHRVIPQKPITLKNHQLYLILFVSIILIFLVLSPFSLVNKTIIFLIILLTSMLFGLVFTIRIGGADMPIAISLLNSLSGVAGAITGLAILDVLLVSIGGIVGASGLLLTQIMCKAMNRSLFDILLGKSLVSNVKQETNEKLDSQKLDNQEEVTNRDVLDIVKETKSLIIVPGYGMAIAQAQHLLKQVGDYFVKSGATVKYAIHPVAGRMPGHMNVLLAEANVDYDDLYEMDDLNDEFASVDLTIVVGANDVLNPAARKAEGTPIYGMPILNVDKSKEIFIFNYDLKPGYSGVDNPLYSRKNGVHLFLGSAQDTLKEFLEEIK